MFKFLAAFFERIFDFFKGVFLFLRDLFLGKRTTQVSADKGTDQIPVTEKIIQVLNKEGSDQNPDKERTAQVSEGKGADQTPVTDITVQSPGKKGIVTISDEGIISLKGKELSEFSSNALKSDGEYFFTKGHKRLASDWKNKNALYYAIINQMHDSKNQTDKYKTSTLILTRMIEILFSKEFREGQISLPKSLKVSNNMGNKKIMLDKNDLIEALNDVYLVCNSDKVSGQRKMEGSEKKKLASDINLLFDGGNNIDILDFIISSKNMLLLQEYVAEIHYEDKKISINLDNLGKLIECCCKSNEYALGLKLQMAKELNKFQLQKESTEFQLQKERLKFQIKISSHLMVKSYQDFLRRY